MHNYSIEPSKLAKQEEEVHEWRGALESLSDYKASLEKEVRSPQLPCATRIVGSQCRQSKSPYTHRHRGRRAAATLLREAAYPVAAEELLNIK